MFTGIIQAVGTLQDIEAGEKGYCISVATPEGFLAKVNTGDSIAVQGVCLTATEVKSNYFRADASNETLKCTTLGSVKTNDRLNLETALTLSTVLGGHLVSGHVDGVGVIKNIEEDGDSVRITIKVPEDLGRYIARKGSVCIDGISLTVNEVNDSQFDVNIIPHTFQNTTFSEASVQSRVNVEVDLIARYLERLQSYEHS